MILKIGNICTIPSTIHNILYVFSYHCFSVSVLFLYKLLATSKYVVYVWDCKSFLSIWFFIGLILQ